MRKSCLAAAAAVLVVGCGSGSGSPGTAAPPPGTDLRQVTLTAAELHGLADADTSFGVRLLQQLQAADAGNLVLSPASIATALQMAYVGARGRTATEMATTLGIEDLTPVRAAAAASRLLSMLAPLAHDKDELLDLVNTVWVQSRLPLTPTYDAMMRTGFDAGLRRTDFAGQSEQARQAINAAVAEATRDKIRDLIAEGQITADTRLVLTNAVYLKAKWDTPFEPAETEPRAFHRGDGSTVESPMMTRTNTLEYADGPGYQAVRLPYAGGRLAMTVVVPTGHDGRYPAQLGPFHPTEVQLWLPKFRFTWEKDLSKALMTMGMPTAFVDGDFSGITTAEALHVSFVQHQAFIDVNENGTEAAAATAIGLGVLGAFAPRPAIAVHADHPFYFAITDVQTGLVLFLGHITDPTAS
jgi:serpin B